METRRFDVPFAGLSHQFFDRLRVCQDISQMLPTRTGRRSRNNNSNNNNNQRKHMGILSVMVLFGSIVDVVTNGRTLHVRIVSVEVDHVSKSSTND
jgi:hypothetical protein